MSDAVVEGAAFAVLMVFGMGVLLLVVLVCETFRRW